MRDWRKPIYRARISGLGREIGMPMFDIRTESAKPPDLPSNLRQLTATITAQPTEAALVALLSVSTGLRI